MQQTQQEQQQQKQDFSTPSGFFDDICIQPNFYIPQNQQLKWATHESIKRSLFYSTFNRIKKVEYLRLRPGQETFFQFSHLENADEGWIDSIVDRIKHSKDLLLGIHVWTINRNGVDFRYRVKYFQTDTDEFVSSVYPLSWRDKFTYLRLNRNRFRFF